ncbi:MAG: UDP-N-acetylmuramate--L-alanine ligase [Chlamydiae bacterium]|nr:UDP-N-acetylmuramate--L-alanine ligase [Chlamydiota bacterium]
MKKESSYHFIGIGGIGMSALAQILLEKQIEVSGSDLSSNANTQSLQAQGARIHKGHETEQVLPGQTVVYSSSIKEDHCERRQADTLSCPLLHRSELLAELMGGKTSFVVTGTHGKTTTTALLTHILVTAGKSPSFAIGGKIEGRNGKWDRGEYFVVEGDESDGSHARYFPDGAIVTNVEAEHLDFHKSEEALIASFSQFVDQVQDPALLFFCGDDPILSALCQGRGVSYGFDSSCHLKITSFMQKGWELAFSCTFEGKTYSNIALKAIGRHNVLNGVAVFGFCLRLGISEEIIREGMRTFPGTFRRCQNKGEIGGVLFLDDYAHHPTEILTTLKGIREAIGERRLVAIFQPHKYSRLHDHFSEFSHAFSEVDQLIVTDVYAAGENPTPDFSYQTLLEAIERDSFVKTSYTSLTSLPEVLSSLLRPHDVCVTLSAGDLSTRFYPFLATFSPKKWRVGLLFGGKSCEHEISLRSARSVAASLDPAFYEIEYFGIDRFGKWTFGEEARETLAHKTAVDPSTTRPLLDPSVTQEIEKCELFAPIFHGPYGEDGTIQGLFEMLEKPYIGPDFRACANSMDKVVAKKLVEHAGIKTPPFTHFGIEEWRKSRDELLAQSSCLTFPLYVKPVHLGSSIGITKVEDRESLEKAIESAFRWDTKVMIEEGKEKCRELEFAVIGNPGGIEVASPGEKLAHGAFVDYEKKYSKGLLEMTEEPDLADSLCEEGKKWARLAYEAVGCTGMARVDFLLDQEGNYWFFELNPIPGLTPLSLFPKIWARAGLPFPRLLDRLAILALHRTRQDAKHKQQDAFGHL